MKRSPLYDGVNSVIIAVLVNGAVGPILMYNGMSQFGCLVGMCFLKRILLMTLRHLYGGMYTCVCVCMCQCVVYRYGLDERVWELIEPQDLWPSIRYSHSAVVYEVCVSVHPSVHLSVCVCSMSVCVSVCV